MSILLKLESSINRFSLAMGYFASALLLLLLLNVFYDVVMRYLFNDVSIGMQELEWHLYAMVFLFGVPYALQTDGHVRVDVIYERLSVKARAIIDVLGIIVFLWPFCALVAYYGIDYAQEAYDIGEMSGDPGGLEYRWIIKSMITIAFTSTIISSFGFMLRSINELLGLKKAHEHKEIQF